MRGVPYGRLGVNSKVMVDGDKKVLGPVSPLRGPDRRLGVKSIFDGDKKVALRRIESDQ